MNKLFDQDDIKFSYDGDKDIIKFFIAVFFGGAVFAATCTAILAPAWIWALSS